MVGRVHRAAADRNDKSAPARGSGAYNRRKEVADRAFKLLIYWNPSPCSRDWRARERMVRIDGIQFAVHRRDGVAVIALVGQF